MIYIRRILNLLTKKGKKSIAVKNVNNSLQKLRRYIRPSRLNFVFDRIVPSVKIYKKKVAGKVYQIPSIMKDSRALFQTAKWVCQAIEAEKKGKKISFKLNKVIWEMVKQKGLIIKLRAQYMAILKDNRSYMRFIRRKRKKKKVWTFQQRFTSNSVRWEKRNRIAKKKILEKNFGKKINKSKKQLQANSKSKLSDKSKLSSKPKLSSKSKFKINNYDKSISTKN